jgi:hypothetical protein
VALLDRVGEILERAAAGVQLGDGAGEACIAVGDPALVARLGLGDFLVALRGRDERNEGGGRGDAHPKRRGGDPRRHQQLSFRGEHEAAHLAAGAQVQVAFRKELFQPKREAREAS